LVSENNNEYNIPDSSNALEEAGEEFEIYTEE
jgi:hypothetical protein